MKIYRIASLDFSAWILSNGEVKRVPYEGHSEFVMKNPSLFNTTPEEIKKFLNFDGMGKELSPYNLGFRSGAIHIDVFGGTLFIRGRKRDVGKHADIIHKIFKTSLASDIEFCPIGDDFGVSVYDVVYQMPVEDLYKLSKSNFWYKKSQAQIKIVRDELPDRIRFYLRDEQNKELGKFTIQTMDDSGNMYGTYFKIDESLRGKGLGKKLMQEALNDPSLKGKKILLNPHPFDDSDPRYSEENLTSMYKGFGFKDLEGYPGWLVKEL